MKSRLILLFLLSHTVHSQAEAIKVTITADGSLLRGGKPYFIKGAGGHDHMDELVRRGGNSFRTWGDGELPSALETAHQNNLTEYGPRGFWESPKTKWNAPDEQTSTDKAAMVRRCYDKAIAPSGSCGGGFIFLWGQKQEATATWFGIFNDDGASTATANVPVRVK